MDVERQDYSLQIQDKRCQFVWIFISYWVWKLIPHAINVDIFPYFTFVIQAESSEHDSAICFRRTH